MNSGRSAARNSILILKVKALYNQKDNVNRITRELFHPPIEERLKQNNKNLKTWLEVVTPTIKAALAEDKQKEEEKQMDIREYLVFVRNLEQRNATGTNDKDNRGGDT